MPTSRAGLKEPRLSVYARKLDVDFEVAACLTAFLMENILTGLSTRGGAVAARRAHNPKAVGSNPTPATNF